jgi:hypothetical protein
MMDLSKQTAADIVTGVSSKNKLSSISNLRMNLKRSTFVDLCTTLDRRHRD